MSDDDKTYDDPNVAINRVYTRKGDDGMTKLVGGHKVRKTSARIEAYGTVDELNAVVGAARQSIADNHADDEGFDRLSEILLRVQHELFNLGSLLATKDEDVREKMARITDKDVETLEQEIDAFNEDLPELRSFVLPGGSRLNVELHHARTICRRAERRAVEAAEREKINPTALAYLNRLGDAFFVWGRWAAVAGGAEEVQWDPNLSSSGQQQG